MTALFQYEKFSALLTYAGTLDRSASMFELQSTFLFHQCPRASQTFDVAM